MPGSFVIGMHISIPLHLLSSWFAYIASINISWQLWQKDLSRTSKPSMPALQKSSFRSTDALWKATYRPQQTYCKQHACSLRMLQMQLEKRRTAIRQRHADATREIPLWRIWRWTVHLLLLDLTIILCYAIHRSSLLIRYTSLYYGHFENVRSNLLRLLTTTATTTKKCI